MVVRNIWSDVEVPEHSTNTETLTIPEDSMSINELFERAARGESLGGDYDELKEDSFFDMSHDPDYQDPLLREAIQLETNEELKDEVRKRSTKKKTKGATGIPGEGVDKPEGNKADSSGSSSSQEVES